MSLKPGYMSLAFLRFMKPIHNQKKNCFQIWCGSLRSFLKGRKGFNIAQRSTIAFRSHLENSSRNEHLFSFTLRAHDLLHDKEVGGRQWKIKILLLHFLPLMKGLLPFIRSVQPSSDQTTFTWRPQWVADVNSHSALHYKPKKARTQEIRAPGPAASFYGKKETDIQIKWLSQVSYSFIKK